MIPAFILTSGPGFAQGLLDQLPGKATRQAPSARPPAKFRQPRRKDEKLRIPDRPSAGFSFLKGCWISDPFKHSSAHPYGTSSYCFNARGQGTLVFRSPQSECRVPARASYHRGKLRMSDSDGKCTDGIWYADHLDCERGTGGEAFCHGKSTGRGGKVWKWVVTFRRKR